MIQSAPKIAKFSRLFFQIHGFTVFSFFFVFPSDSPQMAQVFNGTRIPHPHYPDARLYESARLGLPPSIEPPPAHRTPMNLSTVPPPQANYSPSGEMAGPVHAKAMERDQREREQQRDREHREREQRDNDRVVPELRKFLAPLFFYLPPVAIPTEIFEDMEIYGFCR